MALGLVRAIGGFGIPVIVAARVQNACIGTRNAEGASPMRLQEGGDDGSNGADSGV